jgi:hypothetical protein
MRNALLRKLFGFAGISLCAASCGMLFAYIIAAAQLGFFVQFLLAIVALIMALIAYFKVIFPKLWAWVTDIDLKAIVDIPGVKANLAKFMAAPAAE